jgi:hypothetical protein
MIKTKENLVGQTFERLTVIKQTEDYIDKNGKHYARWLCKCSCGNPNLISVVGKDLKNGHTKSCGCIKLERTSQMGKSRNKFNPVDLDSAEYGIGYTFKNEEFWFDKEDYDLIKNYCWYYDQKGYVVARGKDGKNAIFLHVLVMSPIPDGMVVDHKRHPPRNEKKIDNRKSNLEIKTASQNNINCSLYSNNTSGIKGVSWNKRQQKWVANIQVNKKRISLGYFADKSDAIIARKQAEEKYFGKYSYDANNS